MKVHVAIGSGYGDCGKGLMVDYFSRQSEKNQRTLVIRSNGGTQSGHTVCELDTAENRYNRFVFRNLGSGTFAGADTLLGSRFVLNCYELNKEMQDFKKAFCFKPVVFISDKCRVQFRSDTELNRSIESSRRLGHHGTCGFGVFETVNRHHMNYELRLDSVYEYYKKNKKDELIALIKNLSFNYTVDRLMDLKKKEQLQVDISGIDYQDDAFKTVEDIWRLFDENKEHIHITSLDRLLSCGEYTNFVFECGQGLELNWGDVRNTPHVTASHTGLKNVIKELKQCKALDTITKFEACYITRSYKTKHGAGTFYEKDFGIRNDYCIYDKTNVPNRFQGVLEFGRIDRERMSQLINEDFKQLEESGVLPATCKVIKSLSVTHLDQTNEGVLEKNFETRETFETFFKDFNAASIINGDKTYYSFGEKASDIVVL